MIIVRSFLPVILMLTILGEDVNMKISQEKLFRIIEVHNLINFNDKLPTILLHPNAKRLVIDLVLLGP